ncbi:hypothetical protein GCM10022267_70010 [Lentzea roselyniae]|uniref:Uncharacterized protein n=1 Tax=Lentzea roselyniae TaxID=531940 RepID=A0ABP7C008_9PSEU
MCTLPLETREPVAALSPQTWLLSRTGSTTPSTTTSKPLSITAVQHRTHLVFLVADGRNHRDGEAGCPFRPAETAGYLPAGRS